MKSRIFALALLALLCASCQNSDDEAGDNGAATTERYVGEWIDTEPGSTTSEEWFHVPEEVVYIFKPDTVVVDKDSVYHDVVVPKSKTTNGNDVLTIRGNFATLDMSSTTTGLVDNEIAIKKEYYLVFKSGTYNYGTRPCVVKPDGIFLESNNECLLKLDNYRYKMNYLTEKETVSTKDITVRKSFSAQASTNNGSALLFSRNDTTFRATKVSEGYYLEMVAPSDNDFYNHTMERK